MMMTMTMMTTKGFIPCCRLREMPTSATLLQQGSRRSASLNPAGSILLAATGSVDKVVFVVVVVVVVEVWLLMAVRVVD